MISTDARRVAAIIISYHPKLDLLETLFSHLTSQVDLILVVDNGSGPTARNFLCNRQCHTLHTVFLATNTGIANALNIGLQYIRNAGADMCLTLDQDSLPEPGMVANLLSAYENLCCTGNIVGAVGPVQIDRRTQQFAPFVLPSSDLKLGLPNKEAIIEVDHLITSGCLIPLEVIDLIGPMRTELFIDGVDLDWSWRCRAAGFRLFGVGSARMLHNIGDRVFQFAGRNLSIHTPERLYYITRNSINLGRQAYCPDAWRHKLRQRLIKNLIIFSTFISPRRTYFSNIIHGVLDGLNDKLGPLPKNTGN